jgi:hypothetical protein
MKYILIALLLIGSAQAQKKSYPLVGTAIMSWEDFEAIPSLDSIYYLGCSACRIVFDSTAVEIFTNSMMIVHTSILERLRDSVTHEIKMYFGLGYTGHDSTAFGNFIIIPSLLHEPESALFIYIQDDIVQLFKY